MSSNFQVVHLGSIVTIKGGKRLPKNNSLQTDANSHPYIRVRDMGNRYLPETGLEYVPDEIFPQIKRYIVEENDVIISIVGTIGLVSVIDERFHLASQTENSAKLSGLDWLDALYLYYYLKSDFGQIEINKATVGAVQPKLPLYNIEKVQVIWPEKNQRIRITNVLSSIDDKIELNNQINQTLEVMAQAIFKSWFVDFEPVKAKIAVLQAGGSLAEAELAAMMAISGKTAEQLSAMRTTQAEAYQQLTQTAALFPAAMQESELGEIPEGWENAQIKDFGEVVCGKTPSKSNVEYFGDFMPFIKIPDMNEIFVVRANEYLSKSGAESQKNKTIPAGSICVSCIATVGKVVIAHELSQTNQQINSLIPKSKFFTEYLYFSFIDKKKQFHDLASGGSATLNMNTSTFSKIQTLFPANEILKVFSEKVSPLFAQILNLQKQSKSLSDLRDALLPKLLNGEIRLEEN